MLQSQWKVEAEGDAAPLTISVEVARITVATDNGDQIVLVPEQVGPLVHRLDCIHYDMTFGDS